MKTLILYFSYSNGNTKVVAENIAKLTGGDIEALEPLTPYSRDYDKVVSQGQEEVNEGYLPPLQPLIKNPKDYDLIFIGTPTWWYTMAPVVRSFLTSTSLKDKDLALYMTNAGWPGHVIKDMEKMCPLSKIVGTLEIKFDSSGGSKMITPKETVDDWIMRCLK